jgi:membrane-bound serine protease (ClpP class)
MNTHRLTRAALKSTIVMLTLVAGVSAITARGQDSGTNGPATDAASSAAVNRVETSATRGAIIPIKNEISDVTAESLKRRIEFARERGAQVLVFEIDTPGGMVTSALEICSLIKNLTDIKTIAWVNTEAYSAGSMIAMACDEIVMTPSSTIGDCGVILGGPTGPQEVPEQLRAKAESPVIEEFRDSAARNGYDPLLCESLVVKERVVYWIEHRETGERRFIEEFEKKKLFNESSEGFAFTEEASSNESSVANPWFLIERYFDPILNKDIKLPQPVVKATELLTMSQSRALAFGFCQGIVADAPAMAERYALSGDWLRLDTTWSENLTAWLTSMPVRIFLLVIILLGAYVEFNTPGVGVPGLTALIALGIFVGAPYLTGLANVWEIVIVFIGFALIAVEIFVIPGFGVAGISGILCVIVGLLATFIPEEPGRTFPLYWPQFEPGLRGLETGVIVLASGAVAGVVAMILFSRVMPHLSWLHGAIPPNPMPTETNVATVDPYHGYARVGDVGRITSPLRPAGKARFGDELVDVVTHGEYVEPPAEVVVIEREGNRVVVRPVDDPSTPRKA